MIIRCAVWGYAPTSQHARTSASRFLGILIPMHRLRYLPLLFIGASFLVLLPVFLVSAADASPGGTQPATEADLALMRLAGIPNPRVGMPWNMDDPNTGRAVGETKLWLAQHAIKSANVSCMNPVFAEKLKRLMEAVPGGPPIITSGYRSQSVQNAIIARGDGATKVTTACGSYHPWGLAADFNNNSRQMSGWMRANAGRFGITTIGEWDFHHFQDGQGKYGQCGVCASDAGGNGLLPDSSGSQGSLSDQIRKALGMQQQPPPPPPPPQQQPTLPPHKTTTDQ